ncbi:hypothetical protein [Candidatus Nitrospira allomarina]|jgi:RNase P subunit RPR2|uniref:Uncharacterized protein n=1 Tax=Candidatus Nitrospira allomarina TaxID=3020900 RepID=A0AA96G949_9BACT|nr:hypothetical protein [Candidatus Nitrospira allomarina]WNM56692.1 hypothetical protein PP769_11960 [Candidatus Nitrospira allomarina]
MPPTTKKPSTAAHKVENEIAHMMNQSSCDRCGGLLIKGYCLDVANPEGELWITTKHCIQCGNVIDPVILKNQKELLPTSHQAERVPRPRPSYGVAMQRRKR